MLKRTFLKNFLVAVCSILLPGLTQLTAQPNIVRVEYFIDVDPGFGNGISLPISSANDISTSFNIDVNAVSPGVHVVGMRSKDENGVWSFDNRWIFLKPYSTSSSGPTPNINRVEWFIDNDPGFGNGITLPITPGQDLSGLSFNINMTPLAEGVHVVGVRARDANGVWSFDNRWIFLKPYTTSTAGTAPNITRVEYFVDTDPGFGNATNIPITAGQDIASISVNINMASLAEGVHVVGIRSKDATNMWSFDNRWLFLKPYTNTTTGANRNIARVEYYFDNDPGYGKGIPVALPASNDINAQAILANITNLPVGGHKLFFRTLDVAGVWSQDYLYAFNIGTAVAPPFLNINSVAYSTICKEGTFSVGYHSTGTYGGGNQFVAELSDAAGSFASPVVVGSTTTTNATGVFSCQIPANTADGSGYLLRIRSTNPANTTAPWLQNITINKYSIGPDTSALVVCSNDVVNVYPLFGLGGATTQWSIPDATQAPLGTHQVIATNSVGCKDTGYVLVKQDVATWTGSVSNSWFAPANWSTGRVPGDSTHVIIPSGTPNNPVVSGADGTAASVQLKGGAAITIATGRKVTLKASCSSLPASLPPPQQATNPQLSEAVKKE